MNFDASGAVEKFIADGLVSDETFYAVIRLK